MASELGSFALVACAYLVDIVFCVEKLLEPGDGQALEKLAQHRKVGIEGESNEGVVEVVNVQGQLAITVESIKGLSKEDFTS